MLNLPLTHTPVSSGIGASRLAVPSRFTRPRVTATQPSRWSIGNWKLWFSARRDQVRETVMRQSAGLIGGIRVSPRSWADDQSKADLAHMRELFIIATPPGISMHDHIVVGKNGHASLKGW